MSNIIRILLFCAVSCTVVVGQKKDINSLSLSLVMPSYVVGLETAQIEKLQTTITDLMAANGIASMQMQNNLVIYPIIRLLDERNISAGVQNIIVVEAEISLIIRQIDKSIIFTSITKQLKGSGRTRILAVNNALSQIKPEQPAYVDFISKGKQKALDYYNQQCASIKAQAEQLSKANQFSQALALLYSVPRGTDCYNDTQEKSIEVFKLYQNQVCQQLLQQAQAKIATRSFEEALALIGQVDPQSPCANKVETIITNVSKETSFDNQQQWDTLKKLFADSSQLERYRLQLITDLLSRYYQNIPQYDYQTIIGNR